MQLDKLWFKAVISKIIFVKKSGIVLQVIFGCQNIVIVVIIIHELLTGIFKTSVINTAINVWPVKHYLPYAKQW